ncbi:uncharacterized protein BDZ99DRAFT_480839 [Mytilinidion resinicola]|uniref:Uncharacterized protein n=1 Tax=Mytilinidion resinicola TaxID=574789 RepID=A0A6A6Y8D7_9PEZI|nr:uncharacterized protein BDZ99DRAFT_480839 [Mytilinidion resinicola]KAF2804818.1 hypothetical protein BDZ99DRAFT_480839 [Mytilinidion resinicola]
MHLPLRKTTLLALTLTTPSTALQPRQAITAPAAEFSSAAAQLISLYLPASVQSAIASAASAASVTGDPASVVEAAFTASATPAWFAALPTQYASNVDALESAISQLRGQASTGVPGAPRVVVTTVKGGETITTITGGATSASSATGAVKSAESAASSALSSGLSSASSVASSALSSASLVAASASASLSSVLSSLSASVAAASSTSTSSGFAVPTRVPVTAVGVFGMLGAVLAL